MIINLQINVTEDEHTSILTVLEDVKELIETIRTFGELTAGTMEMETDAPLDLTKFHY